MRWRLGCAILERHGGGLPLELRGRVQLKSRGLVDYPSGGLVALTDAGRAIAQYLALSGRRLEELPPTAPLWDVSDMAFYANLRRYARKAGLAHVTPHVLRHAAAKLRRVTGASLEDVSALLGHRSIATTARYLARLEGEQDTGWPAVAVLLGVG